MLVYNVRKLYRPRVSDALFGDNVDTTSVSLFSCTTAAVFSELHGQLANHFAMLTVIYTAVTGNK